MSASWAVRLKVESIQAALPLRLDRSVEYCQHNGHFFLRGQGDREKIEALVRQIPDAIRYRVMDDEQIVRVGCLIPEGTLPKGPWERLSALFELQPGIAALPGKIMRPVSIRIVRIDIEQAAGALLTTADQWAKCASDAPQARLNVLRFAAAKDGRLLVVGQPLPPIHGDYLMEQEGLLVPCGYGWEPSLEARIIRGVLGLAAGDMALLLADGNFEVIRADSLVRASRSAARLSLARFDSATSTQ